MTESQIAAGGADSADDKAAAVAAAQPAPERKRHRSPHEALWNWTCEFDAEALLASFAQKDRTAEAGIIRNFLGTRIEPTIAPAILKPMAGSVEPVPAPGNWHADIAEWAAALLTVARAAASGRGHYRIVELGCGWGCWMTNMGVAARSRGLAVDLIGVEGDAAHLDNARHTLALNAFGETEFALHHGIAGPRAGKAVFPKGTGESWGGKAEFNLGWLALRRAVRRDDVQVLDIFTLEALSRGQPVDLLHIDIQGAEAEYVVGNMPALAKTVRHVLIGTHGREIEGKLMACFIQHGWRLEMERPAISTLVGGRSELLIDGVQLWANPVEL